MKKTIIIAGCMLASFVALTVTIPVMAIIIPDSYDYYLAEPQVTNNGKVWRVFTKDVLGSNLFSGTEVSEIHAYYWLTPLTGGAYEPDGELIPTRIQYLDNKVTLYFDSDEVVNLQGEVNQTAIIGTLNDGSTFLAPGGPGFAWGRTR